MALRVAKTATFLAVVTNDPPATGDIRSPGPGLVQQNEFSLKAGALKTW